MPVADCPIAVYGAFAANLAIAADDAAVESVPLTMQLGPQAILVNVELVFRDDVRAAEVAAASVRIEAAIRDAHPAVTRVFTEAAPRA